MPAPRPGRPRRRRLPILLVALALALPACQGLAAGTPPPPTQGEAAPDFELRDLDGRAVHLQALRGKPVLINFWYTTCPPCREEMPELSRAYQQYRAQGLTVLAINSQDERAPAVRAFAEALGLAFVPLLDPKKKVTQRYGVSFNPSSVFIARDGRVRYFQIGAMDRSFLQERLREIL